MAAIKSFSDLQQSKKLAEILPLETADMWWLYVTAQGKYIAMMYEEPDPHYLARTEGYGIKDAAIRCWSLAALISILPKIGSEEPMIQKLYYANNPTERYICQYSFTNITGEYDNPVDACYEMIIKLNELNLL